MNSENLPVAPEPSPIVCSIIVYRVPFGNERRPNDSTDEQVWPSADLEKRTMPSQLKRTMIGYIGSTSKAVTAKFGRPGNLWWLF